MIDLTNPDHLTCDEMPPEMLATMKACVDAGARVEYFSTVRRGWGEIKFPWFCADGAYRLWPLIGERREWRGGPCPVPAGTEVTVWRRNNDIRIYQPAKFRWGHSKVHSALDIIAYRVDFLPEAVPILPHGALIAEAPDLAAAVLDHPAALRAAMIRGYEIALDGAIYLGKAQSRAETALQAALKEYPDENV